jgi:cytochrome P450
LVAGHETTSTLLSWILFALAQRPDVQTALRAECRAHPLPTAAHGNGPLETEDLAALDRLPLLDAVVRETLRLHSPVSLTGRAATRDDVIPLGTPFVDRAGVQRTSVPIRKGEYVMIPIRLVNRLESIWGPDAAEWRYARFTRSAWCVTDVFRSPERWTDASSINEKTKSIPALWGSTLAFSGGSHSCIGYKFSLYECVCAVLKYTCADQCQGQNLCCMH